ncbi:MAG: hypothetical protein JWP75_715 [Frondihabitans sp.]|nr:hypothetical protein [Frondihabitans sp.]
MTVSPIYSQHAASANPLFDQVVADIRPKPGRTLSPITTLSRYLDRATAPSMPGAGAGTGASTATAPAAATPTPRRTSHQAAAAQPSPVVDLDRIARQPLSTDDLTAEEREIVAEMGGTVARLILSMLKEDAPSRR